MSSALADRLAQRAADDPDFAGLLEALVDAPPEAWGKLTGETAARLNERRQGSALEEFVEAALSTADVQALLGHRSPQAVHQLRSRGRVIGKTVGNQTAYPAWQFAEGALRDDLPDVLAALGRYADDPVAADRVMRLRRSELDGRSIADCLDDEAYAELAWVILRDVGAS